MSTAPSQRAGAAVVALVALLASLLALAAGAERADAHCLAPGAAVVTGHPLPGSCFEGHDGDHGDDDGAGAHVDWQSTTTEVQHDDYVIAADDSQFGAGGSEESPDSWTFTAKTGIGSDKYDAISAWTFREPNADPADADLFLALAFIRASNNGETHLSFELNQKPPGYRTATEAVDPPATPRTIRVPTRSTGDLLVTYSVSNNNSPPPRIGVCKWIGTAATGYWANFAGLAVGNGECPQLNASVAQAQINPAPISAADNHLTAGGIDTGRFGEAAVNLTEAIKLASGTPAADNVCASFGYVWMHTRSAPSITSNQQDYILPDGTIQVANCAVAGRKFHDLDGDGVRQSATEGHLGGWTIFADYDDDGVLDNDRNGIALATEEPYDITSNGTTDPRPVGTYLISDIKPGTWTIREEQQAGWSCTAPAGCAHSVVMTGALHENMDFGNWQAPRVKVAKVAQSAPADTTTTFSFTSGSATPALASFDLTGGQDTGFQTTAAGSLTITEGPLAGSGFDFANAACTGTDNGATAPSYSGQSATVHLQSGDEITCAFTNTKRGTASGVKYHDRDGDGDQDGGEEGLAGFRIYADLDGDDAHDDGTGADPAEPISAATGGDGLWALSGLVPGTYTLRETGPAGWSCTDPGTGDPTPASTSAACEYDITVSAGGSIEFLKFGNWIAPRIKVVKTTVGGAGTGFGFSSDLPGNGTFTLDSGADTGFVTVAAGSYDISETDPTAAFSLTGASCAGAPFTASGAAVTVTVDSGDEAVCTFANTRKGAVEGIKYEDTNGNGQRDSGEPGLGGFRIYADLDGSQDFTAGEPTSISAAGTGAWSIQGIPAGNVAIREQMTQAQTDAGWICTDPDRGEGAPASSVTDCAYVATVPAGGTHDGSLAFGNWIPPRVKVAKVTEPSGDPTLFDFDSSFAAPDDDIDLAHGQDTGWITPGAGTFTVSETDPTPAYDLTDIACSGTDSGPTASHGGLTATVRLQSGDEVTCTFTNTRRGSISGTKYEDLDGDGTEDPGEPPIAAIRVYADLDDGNDHDAGEPSDLTDASGAWEITGIPAGAVSIRELAGSWTCTQPRAADDCEIDVTIPAGGSPAGTHEFGNWVAPRVKIAKNTLPAGEATVFDFDATFAAPNDDIDLGHGQSTGWMTPGAGQFTVTETDTAPAFDLTAVACTGTDSGTASVADVPTRTATLNLQSRDEVTCTFTNTKLATIEIEKQTDPDEPRDGFEGSFAFTTSGLADASFTLKDDGVKRFIRVRPNAGGTAYTVTEDVSKLYTLGSISCGDDGDSTGDTATRTATIHVSPGETVRCVFTNVRIDGALRIDKTGPARAHHGDPVTFRYDVTNPDTISVRDVAVTDDQCSPVTRTGQRNDNGDEWLDAIGTDGRTPEVWELECSLTFGAHRAGEEDPHVNTAIASGKDEQGKRITSAPDTHEVDLVHPAIDLVKKVSAPQTYVGDVLTYTMTAVNTGDIDLVGVALTDPRCDGGTLRGPAGDDGDGRLETAETWTWTCTHQVTDADGERVTNTATVTAQDTLGGPNGSVQDSDDEQSDVLHPAIRIDKTGPATAKAGERIPYALVVTNPGDVAIVGDSVRVTDPQCDAPPELLAKQRGGGADPTPGTLDPGDRWSYRCFVQTTAQQTTVVNVARVDGEDPNGRKVSDDDDAPTALERQVVLPEAITSGASRLQGPSGCTSRSFIVRVSGRRIKSVVWRVDGRVVARFASKTGEATRTSHRVVPRRYGRGVHRLTARVTYNPAARTAAKTMRMTFQRCARRTIAPRFTG